MCQDQLRAAGSGFPAVEHQIDVLRGGIDQLKGDYPAEMRCHERRQIYRNNAGVEGHSLRNEGAPELVKLVRFSPGALFQVIRWELKCHTDGS